MEKKTRLFLRQLLKFLVFEAMILLRALKRSVENLAQLNVLHHRAIRLILFQDINIKQKMIYRVINLKILIFLVNTFGIPIQVYGDLRMREAYKFLGA